MINPTPEKTVHWKEGAIDSCIVKPLRKFEDGRGWLGEFFRHDEVPESLHPAMGYLSLTNPDVSRGPHEHKYQTDFFLFFSGSFRLYLWDDRETSPTYGTRQILNVGQENPMIVVIPPGIVHAYWNVGEEAALVINCPNKLYAGEGKAEPVDEIRHEEIENSPFIME